MAAVYRVGSAGTKITTNSGASVSAGVTAAAGEVIALVCSTRFASATITTLNGWSIVSSVALTNGTGWLMVRTAAGAESSWSSPIVSTSSNWQCQVMGVIQGIDIPGTWDSTNLASGSDSTSPVTLASVSGGVNGGICLAMLTVSRGTTVTYATYTEDTDENTGTQSTRMTLSSGHLLLTAGGNTPTGSVTEATTGDSGWIVAAFAPTSGLTAVGKDLGLVWDTRTAIGDPIQFIWDTRAALGDTLQTIWDVRAAVTDTVQLIWDTRAAVGDPIDLRWDTRAAVADTLQLVWNVQTLSTAVGKDLGLLWNTRSAIGDPLALVWDVRAALGDSLQLIWNTRAPIGDPVQLIWNTRAAVGDPLQLVWDVRAAVGDPVQLIWNVEVIGLTAVGKNLALLWNLKAPAPRDLQLIWDVRARIGDTVDLQWGIRIPAAKTLQVLWAIRALIGDELQLIWDVNSQAYTPLTDPITVVRGNAAAGIARANLAGAIAVNQASATARPNPAEANP